VEWLAVVAALVVLAGGAFSLIAWLSGRRAAALARAAELLALAPAPDASDPGDADWEIDARYRGVVGEHAVTLALARRLARLGNAAATVEVVRARVELSVPLPFPLEVARRVAFTPSDVETGDAVFDRACAVRTTEPERVRSFLVDPGLRAALVAFTAAGQGSAFARQDAVEMLVFDAHLRGAPAIQEAVRSSVALARKLRS
jgi:hypothetical protein